MRSRRGFLLMELVIGLAVLAIAISLAAAVFPQSRIADQKLQQYRDTIHAQQNTALQMLLTGKPPADSSAMTIRVVPDDQTPNLPAGYHWISVSRKTGSQAFVPLFILAPVRLGASGGQ
ncbi:MAG TPA: prepilin-type N-terminal cleavage/methylation domain-containing protein [Phycisphaerae bacterium]|nr:prepilin-type N-terminal cleavage/methylation domain-containing protein [Phycisphaerae bacterium]